MSVIEVKPFARQKRDEDTFAVMTMMIPWS